MCSKNEIPLISWHYVIAKCYPYSLNKVGSNTCTAVKVDRLYCKNTYNYMTGHSCGIPAMWSKFWGFRLHISGPLTYSDTLAIV